VRVEPEFLHVASGEGAAHALRSVLKNLAVRGRMVTMRDPLGAGPLHDVDAGGAARMEWWKTVCGEAWHARRFDDSPALRRIAEAERVMLWDGPHPDERLWARRACAFARGEVHEVVLPPHRSRHLGGFYGALAIILTAEAAAHWANRARVDDVAARAAEWTGVRDASGDGIRIVEDDRIVEHAYTETDEHLLQTCSEWIETPRAVGTVLADWPIGDRIVVWRVRDLVRAGVLEGRGMGQGHFARAWSGAPAEIRASR
jgi:hypothetical protein